MHFSTLFSLASALSITIPFANAATSGLLLVKSRPTHPELSDKVFNDWYTNEHIRDMVKSGLTDLTVRYRNVNSSATWPYLAIYRVPDVAKLQDPKVMGSVPPTSNLLPGKAKGSKGGVYGDVIAMQAQVYIRSQTFDGQMKKAGRGKGLISVEMEPANGTDAEFDDWYRRQHLDMLSMVKGYRRTTRYTKLDKSTPKYLAMHELDTMTIPPEFSLTVGTEWSKKVLGGLKSNTMERWEYISEFGTASLGQAF